MSFKISPPWKDIPFIMTERNKFVKGVAASLKSSVISLPCRSEITVEIAVTKLVNLNAMGIMSPGVTKAK